MQATIILSWFRGSTIRMSLNCRQRFSPVPCSCARSDFFYAAAPIAAAGSRSSPRSATAVAPAPVAAASPAGSGPAAAASAPASTAGSPPSPGSSARAARPESPSAPSCSAAPTASLPNSRSPETASLVRSDLVPRCPTLQRTSAANRSSTVLASGCADNRLFHFATKLRRCIVTIEML